MSPIAIICCQNSYNPAGGSLVVVVAALSRILRAEAASSAAWARVANAAMHRARMAESTH